MPSAPFHFKKFSVLQKGVTHPVGTDGVLLGAWADISGAQSILDIGTGTGLIALMLAQRTEPNVRILAVDLHAGSIAVAKENFLQSPWKERLEVLEMPVQQLAVSVTRKFDLIVSNPPFFSELSIAQDEARRFARHSATLSIGDLLHAIDTLMSLKGKCCIILPEKEGKRLLEMAVPLGLYCSAEVQVRSREGKPVERLLLQLERDPGRFRRGAMEIYEGGGRYSEAYCSLTKDFYL